MALICQCLLLHTAQLLQLEATHGHPEATFLQTSPFSSVCAFGTALDPAEFEYLGPPPCPSAVTSDAALFTVFTLLKQTFTLILILHARQQIT